MSRSTEYRASGAFIGCLLLVLVPVSIAAPDLFGAVSFAALPEWVWPVCGASAALGAWHIATAMWALDEDLAFITSYAQAHEAAVLILPFVLFVGTRSVFRRLFMPAFVAQQRWATRRAQRLRVERPRARFPNRIKILRTPFRFDHGYSCSRYIWRKAATRQTFRLFHMEPIMAAGTIISVASSIPWGQVIDAAPKVADAAVKLWNSIANRRKQDSLADGIALEADAAEGNEIDQLCDRLKTLEDRVKNLQDQLESSTELLKALAEQNTQLVNRVELNRMSLNRQLIAVAGVGIAMILAIGFLFLKQ